MRALIVEDIGAVVQENGSFILDWAGTFSSRQALEERIGARFVPYLESSIRHTDAGWTLAFNPAEIDSSQRALNGDHWADWLASECPALLVRGAKSPLSDPALFQAMATRRPSTELVTLPGGHVVHTDAPEAYREAVSRSLDAL